MQSHEVADFLAHKIRDSEDELSDSTSQRLKKLKSTMKSIMKETDDLFEQHGVSSSIVDPVEDNLERPPGIISDNIIIAKRERHEESDHNDIMSTSKAFPVGITASYSMEVKRKHAVETAVQNEEELHSELLETMEGDRIFSDALPGTHENENYMESNVAILPSQSISSGDEICDDALIDNQTILVTGCVSLQTESIDISTSSEGTSPCSEDSPIDLVDERSEESSEKSIGKDVMTSDNDIVETVDNYKHTYVESNVAGSCSPPATYDIEIDDKAFNDNQIILEKDFDSFEFESTYASTSPEGRFSNSEDSESLQQSKPNCSGSTVSGGYSENSAKVSESAEESSSHSMKDPVPFSSISVEMCNNIGSLMSQNSTGTSTKPNDDITLSSSEDIEPNKLSSFNNGTPENAQLSDPSITIETQRDIQNSTSIGIQLTSNTDSSVQKPKLKLVHTEVDLQQTNRYSNQPSARIDDLTEDNLKVGEDCNESLITKPLSDDQSSTVLPLPLTVESTSSIDLTDDCLPEENIDSLNFSPLADESNLDDLYNSTVEMNDREDLEDQPFCPTLKKHEVLLLEVQAADDTASLTSESSSKSTVIEENVHVNDSPKSDVFLSDVLNILGSKDTGNKMEDSSHIESFDKDTSCSTTSDMKQEADNQHSGLEILNNIETPNTSNQDNDTKLDPSRDQLQKIQKLDSAKTKSSIPLKGNNKKKRKRNRSVKNKVRRSSRRIFEQSNDLDDSDESSSHKTNQVKLMPSDDECTEETTRFDLTEEYKILKDDLNNLQNLLNLSTQSDGSDISSLELNEEEEDCFEDSISSTPVKISKPITGVGMDEKRDPNNSRLGFASDESDLTDDGSSFKNDEVVKGKLYL